MSKFVIVIPSYNSSSYVEDCLKSVLNCRKIELVDKVLLMDDASKDNTIELAEKTWNYSKIPLVIHKNETNLGQWPNKNKALSLIRPQYDWMLLLHADDLVREDWIDAMLKSIDDADWEPDVIFSECSHIQPDGKISHRVGFTESMNLNIHRASASEEVRSALYRGCYWRISGSAFQLSVFDEVGEFSNKYPYAGDYYWFLRFLSKGKKVAYLPMSLLINRNHESSVAGQAHRSDTDIREFLAILSEYQEYVPKKYVLSNHIKKSVYVLRRIIGDSGRGVFKTFPMHMSTFSFILKNFIQAVSRRKQLD
jgi:glycosyltransferase involved in cell wall biosynthesis